MSINTVDEYERRAQEAEQSKVPVFLKVGRIVVWIVYALVVTIVVVLLLAFVLRLFGASTDAAFTRWVYRNSESAMRPFRGIFPVKELGEVSVLDASLLFGAVVYVFVAIGVDALFYRLGRKLSNQEQQTAQARAQADSLRFQFESAQYAAYEETRRREAEQLAAQRAAQLAAEQRNPLR